MTQAVNKQPFAHFLLHKPRRFYLSTENGRTQSVRSGYQSHYSGTDIFNIIFELVKYFSYSGKITVIFKSATKK